MNSPYGVSHIYDETGSAKARYHELLEQAERHRRVKRLNRNSPGFKARIVSSIGAALLAASGKFRAQRTSDAATPLLNG